MSDYWKSEEVKETFEDWMDSYESSVSCGCGHGCLNWIEKQHARIGLIFRILANKNSTTSLDKLVKLPLDRVNNIWWYIIRREAYRRSGRDWKRIKR